jgi:hypothetical protein
VPETMTLRICAFSLLLGLAVPLLFAQVNGTIGIVNEQSMDVRVQSDANVVVDETFRFTEPQLKSTVELVFTNTARDQRGNIWHLEYGNWIILFDGRRKQFETFTNDRDRLVRFQVGADERSSTPHTLNVRYQVSGKVKRVDDREIIELVMVGLEDLPVARAVAKVHLPPGIPRETVQSSAFTDVTATTTSCKCKLTSEGDYVLIETTSTLEPSKELNMQVSFPKGYVKRPISGEIQAFRENHQGSSALLEFGSSVLLNYLLTFGLLIVFLGKKPLSLAWYGKATLLWLAVVLSTLSMLGLLLLQRPYVAMPGVFIGMVVSMFIGGSAHGPTSRFLWLPFAIGVNLCFYYILSLLLIAALRKVRRGD